MPSETSSLRGGPVADRQYCNRVFVPLTGPAPAAPSFALESLLVRREVWSAASKGDRHARSFPLISQHPPRFRTRIAGPRSRRRRLERGRDPMRRPHLSLRRPIAGQPVPARQPCSAAELLGPNHPLVRGAQLRRDLLRQSLVTAEALLLGAIGAASA